MSTASPLRQLLLVFRHLFLHFKPNQAPRALASLFRKLLVWWSLLRSRWRLLMYRKGKNSPTSSHRPGVDSREPKQAEAKGAGKDDSSHVTTKKASYTLVKDGEVVPLHNVAYSLYPYSAGIRDASRSSHSLQAARSSHNLTIMARNASRSSQNIGSDYSHSVISEEQGYTIDVQHPPTDRSPFRPTLSTPHRQFSTSLPDLQHPHAIHLGTIQSPISTSPSIEVLSPGGGIQHIEFTQSQSPTPTSGLENERIVPVMPDATQRYRKRTIIRKRDIEKLEIEPLKTIFVEPLAPQGWVKCTHPEGARYFYNKEKRIYTEADLFDITMFQQVKDDIATIEHYISENHIVMPDDYHLVLDSTYQEDGGIETYYYFADHQSRTIFLLDTYNAFRMSGLWEIDGCKTDSHLGHEVQAQYWYFVQLYPDSVPLTQALISELRDVALHFIGDSMTSPYSTSPYTMEDLYKILTLTSSIEKNVGLTSVGATSLLTRLLYIFAHSRFLNFYGESHARIERDTSVYGLSTNQRTWLIKTLSAFLFSAPDVHLRTLQKMWVDGLMHKAVWESSMKKMNDEWQEFILFATVLLNANVAFLAIQSVDVNQGAYRSPAQLSSYLSMIASIGSIILGLLLIRQNRTKNRETADDVQHFLQRRSHPLLGLETLAILYSLPYALLMWGMLSFLAAFCFMCFAESTVVTRVLIGSFCVIIVVLVLWCVWSAWEKQPEDNAVRQLAPDDKSTIGSKQPEEESRPSSRPAILDWMPSFNFFEKLRKGSLDSQRTAV